MEIIPDQGFSYVDRDNFLKNTSRTFADYGAKVMDGFIQRM